MDISFIFDLVSTTETMMRNKGRQYLSNIWIAWDNCWFNSLNILSTTMSYWYLLLMNCTRTSMAPFWEIAKMIESIWKLIWPSRYGLTSCSSEGALKTNFTIQWRLETLLNRFHWRLRCSCLSGTSTSINGVKNRITNITKIKWTRSWFNTRTKPFNLKIARTRRSSYRICSKNKSLFFQNLRLKFLKDPKRKNRKKVSKFSQIMFKHWQPNLKII